MQVTKPCTSAERYTTEGQDEWTKRCVVGTPAEGIKNKSDLPDGTKYTWKDTPDVTTAGDKPATVVVSYPDGSKDEVPVTIHVTNPATDAYKYTTLRPNENKKNCVVALSVKDNPTRRHYTHRTKHNHNTTPPRDPAQARNA
ncbi:Rib/alpha-like domain-containing protein, partial [Lactobacillus taiwanensis]|uniref:Rib/alpha-like domain-containing protein n=1 Tax=Lactobacillus taiwanensis TaxID=508451 RepID=UPI0021C30C9A